MKEDKTGKGEIRRIQFFKEIFLENKFIKEKIEGSDLFTFGNLPEKEKEEESSVQFLDIQPKKASVTEIKDGYLVYETNEIKSFDQKKGDAVHRSLSFLGAYKSLKEFKEDLEKRLDLFILSDEEKKSMFGFLSGEEMSKYFVGDITFFTEREILSEKKEILKPDRVVKGADFTAVLDFKTGREKEREHSEQLKKYKNQIVKILSARDVELIIVYLKESKRVYVED